MSEKTHYRKAFNSPYLSSADVVGEMSFTIDHVALEADKTKKTKEHFNTAYFAEKEIRQGEPLKPMVLNVTNSKLLREMTGSPFIDDWQNVPVTVHVDPNVRFGRDLVEGLRLKPKQARPVVTPQNQKLWDRAKAAFLRDKSFDAIKEHADISPEHMNQIVQECADAP
jgi:hypothetical protein